MESVVIVAPKVVTLESLIACVPTGFRVENVDDRRYLVTSGASRMYVDIDPYVEGEMEPGERAWILSRIPDPIYFVLNYSDIELCKRLLVALVDRSDVLVDNDHGVVCTGSEFVSLLEARPTWDWRIRSES
jgi:hypothetical protein